MLNAGFQYLEQRDANDTITKDGVVGKNSPFATSDNSGIYDIIAEDLRWLKENVDDVKDTSDLEAIKQSVTDMYNEMKNDSSFGEAAAKAQAEEAKKQAQAALESATNAKTYRDDVVTKSTEANETLAEIKTYIDKAEKLVDSNKALEQSFSDYVTMASNKAKVASDSATNAATSETNAKTSETNAKASETNAKTSETNAKASETNAKTSETNAAESAARAEATIENLGTHEANAAASEAAAKTSETNAAASASAAKASESSVKQYSINSANSASLAEAWAESSESPDSVADADSTTGKTQSSKTWALYSRDRAISAYNSEKNVAANEEKAATSASNAKASETAAKTSETNAKASESSAATSATNAKTSETNASTSKDSAATSETNAKTYMTTTKEYMDKTQEAYESAQAIQSIVDTAKANAEKCVADVEAVKESLSKIMIYQGSVDNYSDLPTNPQIGYSYNVKNADKEHGVNAGDNVIWNGTEWDNLGGSVDMSLFAEVGKDVSFNTVTATTFTGNLDGTATKATQDADGNVIADTYLKKSGGTMTGAIDFSDSNKASLGLKASDGYYSGIGFTETSILVLTGENGIFFTPTTGSAQTYIDADGYHGNVDGTATKATQDADGNTITTTYATKTELTGKQDKLTFDTTPTANSTNPVTSDGVKKYVDSALALLVSADDKSY